MNRCKAVENRRGLTLIELMIVVAILGILAAVTIPRFANAREQARAASTATSMKTIASAAQRYRADHDEWPGDEDPGVTPEEFKSYLNGVDFSSTPIGGKWDYEDWRRRDYSTVSGTPVNIGVTLYDADTTAFEAIDKLLDDGDLATGSVQFFNEWKPSLILILERGD